MPDISQEKVQQQKAIRLFHMVWSGITKFMKSTCVGKGRSVELTDLGIFVPMRDVSASGRLTQDALSQLKE